MSNNNLNGDFGNIGMGSYGSVSAGEAGELLGNFGVTSNVSISGAVGGEGGGAIKRVNKKNRRKSSAKKTPSFHS